jgi:uncharacterized protein (DUF362 family)
MKYRAFLESLAVGEYMQLIQQGLEWIGFGEIISKDTHIFIKPNLTFPIYRPGVMTNPQAIEAAILAIREYTPNISIGDADSGGYNRFSMDEVYKETGIWQFAEKYGVRLVNLSRVDRRTISFQYSGRSFSLELPRLLTDEIDLLISMPVPKMHANTVVSLAFKNQWGCIPEPRDRLRLHPFFKHVVLEVNKAVKAKVVIMDGRCGLNKNGPMRGHPVELNWILVTNDLGAADRLACELMQIPLERIPYLKYAQELGFIPEKNEIIINQDIKPFRREKFFLRREWTDYPGFLAFHNPFLAYLAYFSPLAEVLHRILYLVREPFYNYQRQSK